MLLVFKYVVKIHEHGSAISYLKIIKQIVTRNIFKDQCLPIILANKTIFSLHIHWLCMFYIGLELNKCGTINITTIYLKLIYVNPKIKIASL